MNDNYLPYAVHIGAPVWTATFTGGPWNGVKQAGFGEPPSPIYLEATLRFMLRDEEGAELKGRYVVVKRNQRELKVTFAWKGPRHVVDGTWPLRPGVGPL